MRISMSCSDLTGTTKIPSGSVRAVWICPVVPSIAATAAPPSGDRVPRVNTIPSIKASMSGWAGVGGGGGGSKRCVNGMRTAIGVPSCVAGWNRNVFTPASTASSAGAPPERATSAAETSPSVPMVSRTSTSTRGGQRGCRRRDTRSAASRSAPAGSARAGPRRRRRRSGRLDQLGDRSGTDRGPRVGPSRIGRTSVGRTPRRPTQRRRHPRRHHRTGRQRRPRRHHRTERQRRPRSLRPRRRSPRRRPAHACLPCPWGGTRAPHRQKGRRERQRDDRQPALAAC